MRLVKMFSVLALMLALCGPLPAQSTERPESILLTVILRHDQSLTLDQIGEKLTKTGFWDAFPPKGVDVVSWNIVMGIGHVITLRLPPSKLREVNLALEKTAWGAFRTEFYPTYDYKAIREETRQARSQAAGAV